MRMIKWRRFRAARLRRCVLILASFLFIIAAFRSPAQEPHYWSIALADTLMRRNTGAPGDSLTKWSYWKGYTLNGFEMLWQSTGDRRYLDYIKQQIDPFIDRDGNLVGVKLDSLDNAMAGNIVIGLYEHTHDPRYRVAATQLRGMFDHYPRNPDGGFWHNPKLPGEMWVDGVFMGEMFLLRYGDVIGDRKYCFDEAVKQITIFAHHALKDDSGLYYHAWAANPDLATVAPQRKVHWADPATGLSPEVWSEGLGWYALVVVEALTRLPADYPRRTEVLDIYKRLAAGLEHAQDPLTGGWFFVVDKPDRKDNWIDTSGSAMFTFALERGIELGLLDRKEYAPIVAAGYRAITRNARINSDGLVDIVGACDGVCVQASYSDYVGCKRTVNAKEAVGGFLWATTIVEKPSRVNSEDPTGSQQE
jgi:unsaturated rhamnogalacturonyl hydrolase